jgi:predicted nucleic acid-binding protein
VVLVDSSVWIMAEHGFIVIADVVPDIGEIATCPVIVQEVLRGVPTRKRYRLAREALFETIMLDAPTPFERFEQAAQVYLACRDEAITPRSGIDCLIAATALAYDATVLHDDRDFENIAKVLPLRTQPVTIR